MHAGVRRRVGHPHFDAQVRSWLVRGEYETPETRIVERHLPRNLDVVELGGGMGYVSCCIDRLLDSDRTHVVVEADSDIVPVLAETRAANGAEFTVHPAAYAPVDDRVPFYRQERFTRNSIRAERASGDVESVPAVSLGFELVDRDNDVYVFENSG